MRKTRTTRHRENDKMSWAKRRDRKTRRSACDESNTSGKAGRDEERDGRRDGMRRDAGTRRDRQRGEDLTRRGTRQAERRDRRKTPPLLPATARDEMRGDEPPDETGDGPQDKMIAGNAIVSAFP